METRKNISNIPQELQELPQWVNWRAEIRDGKATKIPVNPQTLSNAQSNNPKTWTSFQTALHNIDAENIKGCGFVVTESDPNCGLDFDNCIDSNTGVIEPWALRLIEKIGSYSEVSPSGTGIRIFVKAKLPEGMRKKGRIEIYDSGRFFTVTGNALNGSREVKEWNGQELHEIISEEARDLEIIDKASSAKNGEKFKSLYQGDWAGYPSQSEADMALVSHLFFYTNDKEWTEKLFRKSGLFRDKWDEKHFADGRTYGQKIIDDVSKNTSNDSVKPRTIVLSKFRPRPFTDEIKSDNHFIWEGKRGTLWRYNQNKKLWTADGEAFVESYFRDATASLDDTQKQRNVIAEIIADVAGSSYREDGLPEASISLIPFQNGVYDLQSDSFRDARAEDYFTWTLPWKYNPEARGSFLKGLLDSMMPEPETLYELMAYSLWRGYPYQKFWLLVGPGSNGKGVYLTIFSRTLGPENVSCVSLREIQNSHFAAGTLHRKLANLSGEVDYSDLNNTGLLKQLTGGDQIQGDRKYLSPVRFVNHAKLIFATNQVPVTRDCTDAFYRRAFLVEFPKTFRADPTIDVKLREDSEQMTEEYESLLAEIVQRLRELIKHKFIFTHDQDTENVRARYEALSNPLRRFVSENCEQTFSGSDYIFKWEFRERLNFWLLERKFNEYTEGRIGREMQSLGFEDVQRGDKKYRAWVGIRWSDSQESQESQPFINRSHAYKEWLQNGCERCERCDTEGEVLAVTELSS